MEICSLGLRGDMPETWNRGGSQESMGVILAETHNSGDMEPEEDISYSQAGPPSGMSGTPTHPQNL